MQLPILWQGLAIHGAAQEKQHQDPTVFIFTFDIFLTVSVFSTYGIIPSSYLKLLLGLKTKISNFKKSTAMQSRIKSMNSYVIKYL